jgi:hypothetical protein
MPRGAVKSKKPDFGKRRTSVNPPTIEEAVFAAQGLTADFGAVIEIAAELSGLPKTDVEAVARAAAHASRGRSTVISGSRRVVVVARPNPRLPAAAGAVSVQRR